MDYCALKVVAVTQAGDTLTAMFNDGRSVDYSISMLDSEFEEIESTLREKPLVQELERAGKRQRPKLPRSKRPGSETRPLRTLSPRKAS